MGGTDTQTTNSAYTNTMNTNVYNNQHTKLVDNQVYNSNETHDNSHVGNTINGQTDNLNGMTNNGAQTFKLMNLQNYQPQLILINLDTTTNVPTVTHQGTNTSTHNGDVVEGSYFKMGNVNNQDGAVLAVAPTGKNRVDIDTLTSNAGSSTVFMGGAGPSLMNMRYLY